VVRVSVESALTDPAWCRVLSMLDNGGNSVTEVQVREVQSVSLDVLATMGEADLIKRFVSGTYRRALLTRAGRRVLADPVVELRRAIGYGRPTVAQVLRAVRGVTPDFIRGRQTAGDLLVWFGDDQIDYVQRWHDRAFHDALGVSLTLDGKRYLPRGDFR
jgi:hypothetical protein